MSRAIPATNEIQAFLHCRKCIEELLRRNAETGKPVSPRQYLQLEVGWTALGLQVWCVRHEINVVSIDFQGQRHPANLGTA